MYNLLPMRMSVSIHRWFAAALLCSLACAGAGAQTDQELNAGKRLFPEIGAGVWAVKHGPSDRYYVLVSRAIFIFDAAGTKVAQIPPAGSKENPATPTLVYGVAFDVDAAGRIYVADRGANALLVFSPTGEVLLKISFPSPTGIVSLSGGEIAATSATGKFLVNIFDAQGKYLRSFGDPVEILDGPGSVNRFMNIGRLATDAAGNIYYSFDYLPEPTFRKYDRVGYASQDIALDDIEFAPASQAIRRELKREVDRGSVPELQQRINCFAVDPESQKIWMALGDELLLLDTDGRVLFEYRTFTPDGARITPNSILVEPGRLIITSDPLGVYEFPRTDKDSHTAAPAQKSH
jgi:hypothetical protein